MSRCCDNCDNGHYFCETLNLENIKNGNYSEGMLCDLTDSDTTFNNVCEKHVYIEGMEEYKIYVVYDESDLGVGFFIIFKLDDEIIKFIKIYLSNQNELPHYNIRAFEKNSFDQKRTRFKKIEITINPSEELFNILNNLITIFQGIDIESIDLQSQSKNTLLVIPSEQKPVMVFTKSVLKHEDNNDFIDINVGNIITGKYYNLINFFYQELAKINTPQEDEIQEVLKLTRI